MPAKAKRQAHKQRIELMELGEIAKRRDPKNVKKHDLDLIGESFEEHGYVDMIGIDDKSGLIARGHGRTDELLAMKEAGKEPPPEIEVRKGKWFVPVVRGLRFRDRKQLTKYQLADNKISEKGGWESGLGKALAALGDDLVGTGFDSGDLVAFSPGSTPTIGDIHETYAVIVECRNERDQARLLRRFTTMGLKVKALVS